MFYCILLSFIVYALCTIQQIFIHVGTCFVIIVLNEDYVSFSMTQHSESGKDPPSDPSTPSLTLYNWAKPLIQHLKKMTFELQPLIMKNIPFQTLRE